MVQVGGERRSVFHLVLVGVTNRVDLVKKRKEDANVLNKIELTKRYVIFYVENLKSMQNMR